MTDMSEVTEERLLTCVTQCLNFVTLEQTRLYTSKVRRYMLAHTNIKQEKITYDTIKKFVATSKKSHRSVQDDAACINSVSKYSK